MMAAPRQQDEWGGPGDASTGASRAEPGSAGSAASAGTPCTAPTVPVRAGSRMPGVPEDYGSLLLRHGGESGWSQGITFTAASATTANDLGTARAPGYLTADADVTYAFALGQGARMLLSARVDNLADRRYIGSVIVNDGNGRYYEPAPGRTWMLGARLMF